MMSIWMSSKKDANKVYYDMRQNLKLALKLTPDSIKQNSDDLNLKAKEVA